MNSVSQWLMIACGAALGTTLLQILTPSVKSGLDKYVKFVASAAVLLIVITPLFEILSDIDGFLGKTGIISQYENINVTEESPVRKWILSQTLTSLESGVKKLVKEKFYADIQTEFETDISQEGIEIKSVVIHSEELVYARKAEIAAFLEDYLGIEVRVKNDVE